MLVKAPCFSHCAQLQYPACALSFHNASCSDMTAGDQAKLQAVCLLPHMYFKFYPYNYVQLTLNLQCMQAYLDITGFNVMNTLAQL